MLTIAEHAWNSFCALVVLAAVDRFGIRPYVHTRLSSVRDRTLTRWFFLHSFANCGVVFSALGSIVAVVSDPVHAVDSSVHTDTSLFGSASPWPLTIINAVHVYHMIGGFNLSPSDYFHHLLFIPTLGFPGQVLPFVALGNFQAFFISGFPGGIDYFLLGLQKVGLLEPMTEKRVNANLNVWCRAPGITIAWTLLYIGVLYNNIQVPAWAYSMQMVLPAYNALYYGKQAVANYAVHFMLNILGQDELIKKRIQERKSVMTGEMVMDWKDALTVPQRGS